METEHQSKNCLTQIPQGGGSPSAEFFMFSKRPSWFYGLLIAAFVGPYALLDKSMAGNLWKNLPTLTSFSQKKPAETPPGEGAELRRSAAGGADANLSAGASFGPTAGSTAGAPTCDIPEAFRFDVSPQWITSRWPRVTTVLAESDLQGLRVPLVTGSRPDDLAGSLTYYFDKKHTVQRIAFQGNTGDERRLVAFLSQYYQMKPVPALGAGLYMTQVHGKPLSTLHLTWPPVVAKDKPTDRCEIVLELNRANVGASEQVQQMLDYERRAKKW
ncbi:MAG: hypothetical protein K8R36_10175 [Planctomycetales bacterium]|nr:hypothetical protein [Planctomycetales bacterium]